jgi:DNA transposition AAA+ family ATPase
MTTSNVSPIADRASAPAFGDHYTEQDRADVARVLDWLDGDPKRTRSWIARAAGDSPSAVTSVLNGKYPSPPAQKLARYLDVIARADERSEQGVDGLPVVPTSVYQIVSAICARARLYRSIGIVSGYVGTGKTTALERYADDVPAAVYLDGDPDMTPRGLLEDLAEALGVEVTGRGRRSAQPTQRDLFRAVVRHLKGSDRLVILDEADKVSASTLEHVRRLRDKARIGVVLAGTERLQALLRREHGQFDQVGSRVVFWPPVIRGITRDDCAALVQAAFAPEDDEGAEPVADEVVDACWALTQGSMRLLAEGLIPAVRDYGTAKGYPLDGRLVYSVGKQALNLRRKAK